MAPSAHRRLHRLTVIVIGIVLAVDGLALAVKYLWPHEPSTYIRGPSTRICLWCRGDRPT